MKQTVFILATCRRPELLPYTLLVFQTIRIGFPNGDIFVYANGSDGSEVWAEPLKDAATAAGCHLLLGEETTHHEWIEKLVATQPGPFWICDTDMVFYRSVEDWDFGYGADGPYDGGAPIAGCRIPEFRDDYLKAVTRSRLHTSLMRIDPNNLMAKLDAYESRMPRTRYNPRINPIHPVTLPFNGHPYFYDTMALAYHAVGGAPFTPEQKDAYFHFHFGTFSDMVLPALPDGDRMRDAREAVLKNPEAGRGLWRAQDEWFASKAHVYDGTNVIAPISQSDAAEAVTWNNELCCGRRPAMAFNDLWYNYVHGIDDLIDTLEDGRPKMSKEQIISLFFHAALFYNDPFYVANRDVLFPIVLQVTNTYADSVAWEQSPKPHLRAMGDVFRTCGNEMFIMVALLCGGEQHMRKFSRRIKERDWLGQHNELGQPI